MLQPLIFLIVGIFGLWLGATLIVEASKKLAARLGISQTLIGLSIISIGTSLPEIMTSVLSGIESAHGADFSGVAVGTNIGSSLTQITLIFGLTTLFGTVHATKKILKRDGFMALFAIVLMFLVSLDNLISQVEGFLLIVIYISYLFYISRDERAISKVGKEFYNIGARGAHIKTFVFMLIGFFVLLYAANLVIDNAVALSKAWGIAQSFIGVMIIGVGACLPELSTAVMGILKKAEGISIGTLIGSNITNPMFALGSGAIFSGFAHSKNLLFFDTPFWFFATVLTLLLLSRNMKLDKSQGIVLIGIYILFAFLKIKFFLYA